MSPSLADRILIILAILVAAADSQWLSPVYENFYEFPLPIPPEKKPLMTFSYENGPPIDYYEVEIKPVEVQIYPKLGKTRLVAYDGVAPGPTFRMTKGREAVVRFINHGDLANSVHLHGSYSRAPFDGWAEDTTEPNQYKDYYYPNAQNARTLWYHDHAIDHTAKNAYFGQAGFYILHDDQELATPGLPQGDYDIPLALATKRYNADGSLWDPDTNGETTSLYGDVTHVNGQPWPYFAVEPRKYRFRFLDTSVSRSYELYFEDKSGKRASFVVVGSDAGLLLNPITSTQLDISMAERWEVVFDFTSYAGQNVTLKNNRDVGADDDYSGTDKVMRFVVGKTVKDQTKNDALPSVLRNVPFPPSKTGVDRTFRFERGNGKWQVNKHSWSDGPEDRILAKPARGQVEVWELENGGGGWSHPIHIHLIDFQIISRSGGARDAVLPYEKVALKDVVWLNTGETVRVIARWAPWDGLYMFHCHNLIHEDHEMMVSMNVTALADLGYDEKTRFIDPMDPKYRAVGFGSNDFQSRTNDFSDAAIKEKCRKFNDLEAYVNVEDTEKVLETYWATHTSSRSASFTTKTSTTKATSAQTSALSGVASTKTSASSTKTSTTKASSTKTSTTKSSSTKTSTTKASSTTTKK